MPSKKISQLPSGTPTGVDIFPFVQSGVTKKGTISSLISSSYVELTYASANTLVSTSGLTKGASYKITDRGDNGILLQAIDVNKFSPEGVRFMLCPNYNVSGTMLGFWNGISATTIFNTGDTVIWGGYYWENFSGGTGSALDVLTLNPDDWTLKTKSLSNGYEEKQFIVSYDFDNDWIEKQYDGYGNVVGVPYEFTVLYTFNPCDHSDWNVYSSSAVTLFYDNKVASGFINNSMSGGEPIQVFFDNIANIPDFSSGNEFGITNNIFFGGNELFFSNKSSVISNNTTESIVLNQSEGILRNYINGSIESNVVEGIVDNTNNGYIVSNIGGNISQNSNDGYIYQNNVTTITFNSNLGVIEFNNLSLLQSVTVSGSCAGNTGGGSVAFPQPFSGDFSNNVIDYKFGKTYYEFNFTTNPLISGTPQYFQSIPNNSRVMGFSAVGNGLSSATNSANIEVGPSVDDPSVISVSIVSLNSGFSDDTFFSIALTTTSSRTFEINAITEDVTGGTLSVWIDYLIL